MAAIILEAGGRFLGKVADLGDYIAGFFQILPDPSIFKTATEFKNAREELDSISSELNATQSHKKRGKLQRQKNKKQAILADEYKEVVRAAQDLQRKEFLVIMLCVIFVPIYLFSNYAALVGPRWYPVLGAFFPAPRATSGTSAAAVSLLETVLRWSVELTGEVLYGQVWSRYCQQR